MSYSHVTLHVFFLYLNLQFAPAPAPPLATFQHERDGALETMETIVAWVCKTKTLTIIDKKIVIQDLPTNSNLDNNGIMILMYWIYLSATYADTKTDSRSSWAMALRTRNVSMGQIQDPYDSQRSATSRPP